MSHLKKHYFPLLREIKIYVVMRLTNRLSPGLCEPAELLLNQSVGYQPYRMNRIQNTYFMSKTSAHLLAGQLCSIMLGLPCDAKISNKTPNQGCHYRRLPLRQALNPRVFPHVQSLQQKKRQS